MADQRTFVLSLRNERTSNMPERIVDDEENWNFEGIVIAEEMASSDLRRSLPEVERDCDDGGKAVPTTIVDVNEQACEGIKLKRKVAALSDRNTDMEAEHVKPRAVEGMMRG